MHLLNSMNYLNEDGDVIVAREHSDYRAWNVRWPLINNFIILNFINLIRINKSYGFELLTFHQIIILIQKYNE
jgi:hypothetical protein